MIRWRRRGSRGKNVFAARSGGSGVALTGRGLCNLQNLRGRRREFTRKSGEKSPRRPEQWQRSGTIILLNKTNDGGVGSTCFSSRKGGHEAKLKFSFTQGEGKKDNELCSPLQRFHRKDIAIKRGDSERQENGHTGDPKNFRAGQGSRRWRGSKTAPSTKIRNSRIRKY